MCTWSLTGGSTGVYSWMDGSIWNCSNLTQHAAFDGHIFDLLNTRDPVILLSSVRFVIWSWKILGNKHTIITEIYWLDTQIILSNCCLLVWQQCARNVRIYVIQSHIFYYTPELPKAEHENCNSERKCNLKDGRSTNKLVFVQQNDEYYDQCMFTFAYDCELQNFIPNWLIKKFINELTPISVIWSTWR